MRKVRLIFYFLIVASYIYAAEDEEPTLIAAANNQAPGFTSEGNFGPDTEDQQIDPKVLRDFVESRGLIECRQKCGQLTIAGDVRARWTIAGENIEGVKKRGFNTNTALNRFRSEVNLFFDYTDPRSWVTTKLRFITFLGKDGGTATKVETDRAFLGYDIYNCEKEDFYIELGRTRMDYLFESRVEFGSVFDGMHLYYTNCYPNIGTFIIHGGPFIIDSYSNHYGYAFETGVKELGDTYFSVKYALVNWRRKAPTYNYGNLKKSGTLLIDDNPRYRFIVSQVLFGYERPVDYCGCNTIYLYGAVLANHAAKKSFTTNNKYANKAFYLGFTLGKLCKAGDWSIDINYQYVQAQAIPEFDLSGITTGDGDDTLLSDSLIERDAPFKAHGFTNYKGPQFSLLYALTETLSIRTNLAFSNPIDSDIGGNFHYKTFDLTFVYAF